MHSLFEMSSPWWTFVIRGALTYLGLLILMRLTGKRSFGHMSAFDLIVLVLVGGTLRTAIIGSDQGFFGPFIGIASILAADKILGWACARSESLNRVVEGQPAVLIREGHRCRGTQDPERAPSGLGPRVACRRLGG
jgi:uncharacterized membrane protein YcaP (DUF421 family)